jgi:rfaE bifunctional protein kinase chain/domain
MLSDTTIRRILDRLPNCSVAVVGDFFLDKYLDIDGRLTEKSVETGLDAYQIAGVRTSPGAGGTVTNNLAALGVGRIVAVTIVGSDGEGFELRRELTRRRVDSTHVIEVHERATPTYTKPMLSDGAAPARELNRLDIKNRRALPEAVEHELMGRLEQAIIECDAVIVADQVKETDCGVMTRRVRDRLAELAARFPAKVVLADSRDRIGMFRNVLTKPNRSECLAATCDGATAAPGSAAFETALRRLSSMTGRPVYGTAGEEGILYADGSQIHCVPGYPVTGPIDIVGAGDSTSAGIVCALCSGADPLHAAAFGNLIASITIQQIGTTGTATPDQVWQRWREVEHSP